AGVEEAGVMDPELAHRRIDGGHFGGVQSGDLDRLARGQDVEFAGVEQQLAKAVGVELGDQRLPEVAGVVAVLEVEVDDAGGAAPARPGGRSSRVCRCAL